MDLSGELILISDVHLHHCRDKKSETLMSLLDLVSYSKVGTLVLLGDILDFCLGSSAFYKKKFALLGEKLQQVADSGTRVIFVEGNHEFDIPKIDWPGIEFCTQTQLVLKLENGNQILLTHGDLMHSNRRYRWFRQFVKSKLILKIVSWLPHEFLDRLANGSAKISRASDVHRTIDHSKILYQASQWLHRFQCQFLVFGHFHVPYAEHSKGAQRLFSMDCWDKPNFLLIRNQVFFRGYWPTPSETLLLQKALPLFADKSF